MQKIVCCLSASGQHHSSYLASELKHVHQGIPNFLQAQPIVSLLPIFSLSVPEIF